LEVLGRFAYVEIERDSGWWLPYIVSAGAGLVLFEGDPTDSLVRKVRARKVFCWKFANTREESWSSVVGTSRRKSNGYVEGM
jgi:hypothetical protein